MSNQENPLLAPIHGISLKDYAAIAMKLSTGVTEEEIFRALGIDSVIWDEVNTLWGKRMQEDVSYQLVTLYGQYFMEGATHPKLESMQAESTAEGNENLEKITNDRYFYEELCGARQAAYAYGIDGAQWIQDNYGINLGDFQAVAMKWMTQSDYNDMHQFIDYQQQKQKEYAEKFAAQQGGNVADDVSF
ncbi:hypothetical protein PBAL39_00547 [Pedobacter sp. BAL39]|uniref:DUF6620 family protein n=1 Tax=Pedobacter sp. BAL39 TaxID=391596 RepID=UPI0001559B79|nr:DUF6620 family protein [Pedobacter sp. BAL39]EDM38058.1 hypothetical protein PBAL39_00547 [Pedobacter sp. BAL39]